ncbi:hypothetical protein NVP1084O_085 [Vibrio phage 1.084.O._10N.261.49.F5]|nr:hypothetical protein NVP1084O_085 [Vibrio phage 1.084.O._10N.261.49.F5]
MITRKWESPLYNDCGMGLILAERIKVELGRKMCWFGSQQLPNEMLHEITDIIVHSYRQTGTSLTVATEIRYKGLHGFDNIVRFGNVLIG